MANIFQILLAQLRPKKKISANRHTAADHPVKEITVPKEKVATVGEELERTRTKVEKEDFLLSQIDEFREKAKQLQDLLASKESKAQELQSLVKEREDKAQQLEQILAARQEEADLIRKDFNKKVDELSDKVTNKMTDIEASISNQVLEVKNVSLAQLEENRKLSEEQIEANKKLGESQVSEVKQLLDHATTQLESIKTDLSEKVHNENVKCYRNIQDLFSEFDSKIEKMDEMEKSVGSIRGYVKCLTWFSMINFVLLIAFILYSLGVFNF